MAVYNGDFNCSLLLDEWVLARRTVGLSVGDLRAIR